MNTHTLRNTSRASLIFPLLFFIFYTRIIPPTPSAYFHAFMGSALLAIATTLAILITRARPDYALMGANGYFVAGAVSFMLNSESMLAILAAYKGPGFIICAVTGIIAGALLDAYERRHLFGNNHSMLLMGGVCLAAIGWAFLFNGQHLFLSAALPFIILQNARNQLLQHP